MPWVPRAVCLAAIRSDVGVVCVFEHPAVMDSVPQGLLGFGQISVVLSKTACYSAAMA